MPIVEIDNPMAASAVAHGRNIGLVCTATSTVAASSALCAPHAGDQELNLTVLLKNEAYTSCYAATGHVTMPS